MSQIKNGGLDRYGVEPFEQQQFEAAGIEGVNVLITSVLVLLLRWRLSDYQYNYRYRYR